MKALGQESTVKKFQQARMPTSMRTSHLKPTKTRFWIFLLLATTVGEVELKFKV
jgi:hypothetical protein